MSISTAGLFSQVSVEVMKSILVEGETTQVVISVSDPKPGQVLNIYSIHAEEITFENTSIVLTGTVDQTLPFVITLPITANSPLVVLSQYAIVAEVITAPEEVSITAISPGQGCSGSVETGSSTSMMEFTWESQGDFSSYEIVFYENDCGKHPPGTPTTPTPTPGTPTTPTPGTTTTTPTPTPSATDTAGTGVTVTPTQPGQPILPREPGEPISDQPHGETSPGTYPGWDLDTTDTGLPPLPPGWVWGDTGPTWTGEHPPEPPELPDGWEWGPLYPHWVGEGNPPTNAIIGTSGIIPAIGVTVDGGSFQMTVDVRSFVAPGQAFVYQVFGVAQLNTGTEVGVLSNEMCGRYSPINDETGETVSDVECPEEKAGCGLNYSWVRKTPIKVIKPLDNFPKGDDLKQMIPGECISFSILANDFDLIKQECEGQEDCAEREKAIKRIGPIEHAVTYAWKLNGEGVLKEICQNTIFYQTPKKFKKNETKVATIDIDLANGGGKIADDAIKGIAKLMMTFIDSCKCIDTKIELTQPKEKTYNEDFEEKEAKLCKPKDPEWKKDTPIAGTITIQKELCPESLTILKAAYSDNDKLKMVCEAETCGKDEEEIDMNDPLQFTWNDGGAGGSFPLGNTGPCVLYKAPTDPKKVTININVRDSGTQAKDDVKNDRDDNEVKQLLDLTEINVGENAKYKNITVGNIQKFKPVWTPRNAKVKKIVWELDLGGPTGKIKRVLCDPDGMTQDEASLEFHNRDKEEGLEVSWELHSHFHEIKVLKCEIIGEAPPCGDCCLCKDDKWKNSDFLGRDPLDITQFKLFFEKEKFVDDGRVPSQPKAEAHDEYGEKTDVHGTDAINWFKHWSKTTYATCEHDHKLTDPKVKFRNTNTWLGLYEKDANLISLAKKAAKKSKRKEWKGKGFIEGSDMKYIDTKLKTQRAYNLKGHTLATKVFLHEMGHFVSMTKYWRAGELWTTAYGARSNADVSVRKTQVGASNLIDVLVEKTGTYGQTKADGIDAIQKFNITITTYKRQGGQKVVDKNFVITNTWFVGSPSFKWTNRARTEGTVSGTFEVMTVKKKYVFKGLVLEEFNRANDPDDDYVPNQVEDQIGTSWQHDLTHTNHARGKRFSSSGARQLPDQEFWADHYMFQQYNLVEPGNPDKDWANPGAQTDPEYK
jgi:hypothetical protein